MEETKENIFKEIILKIGSQLAATSTAGIALGIVCNLPRDKTANDSEQPVRCPVVRQKPVPIGIIARIS